MSRHQEWLIEMEFHVTSNKMTELVGIQQSKPKEIELLESFVSGRDTFVSKPTGYGNSIILVEVVATSRFLTKITHF